VKFIHQDIQGSTRTVTSLAGNVTARMDYQAFGEQIPNAIGQRTTTGFAGNDSIRHRYGLTERDEATGLDDTWWRKHENRAGRWTSPDPYNGSMEIDIPESFNRFTYVLNQPTNFIDPSGLRWELISYSCWCVNASVPGWTDPNPQCSICTAWVWREDRNPFLSNGGEIGGTFSGGGGNPTVPTRPPVKPKPPCVPSTSTPGAINDGVGGAGTGMRRTGGTVGNNGRYYPSNWGGNGSVRTFSVTNVGGKLATGSGAINAGMSGVDIATEIVSEGRLGPRTARAVGRAVGNVTGSTGGAFVGAAVGAVKGGPLGAIVGGIIGSVTGGAAGSHVGNEIVHGIQDRNLPRGVRSCP